MKSKMTTASNLRIWRITHLLLIVVLLCPLALSKVIYVDDDAVGLNDGSSWQNAYNFLQDALYDAETSEKPIEIRVAQGVYKPDQGSRIIPRRSIISGDSNETFQLFNDVIIKGGYAGLNEHNPNSRDAVLYETILSGDLAGNDVPFEELGGIIIESSIADNSYRIVTANAVDNTILEGLIITGAILSRCVVGVDEPEFEGAGLFISDNSSIIVRNCIFTQNATSGIFCKNSSPTFINCTFKKNIKRGHGGGMCICDSNIEIKNCTFNENQSFTGGGIESSESMLWLENCVFTKNVVHGCRCAMGGLGGALCCADSRAGTKITQSLFSNNIAIGGAGIFIGTYDGTPFGCGEEIQINGCSFTHNQASFGAAIGNYTNSVMIEDSSFIDNSSTTSGGALGNTFGTISFSNCLFTGNSAGQSAAVIYARGSCWPDDTLDHFFAIEFKNCTLVENIAPLGRMVTCRSDGSAEFDSIQISNCIISNGGNEIYNRDGSEIIIDYTILSGGTASIHDPCNAVIWGMGNINEDPLFANPGYWADVDDPNIVVEPNDPNAVWIDGDYHLKSQAGRWDPVRESWIQDDVTSPCIDAGDPNVSVGDELEPNGGRINMGAYGGTPEASKSYILAKMIYVDDDAIGNNDGSSWQNAYTFLQDALTTARKPDVEKPLEIRVAQGTYKPNQGLLPIIPPRPPLGGIPQPGVWPADRGHFASFELINGVTIRGGYAGLGEPDPNERDIELYQTVLSGDLNGDDIEVDDPCDLFDEPTRSDNSNNVITSAHNDQNAVIDGFTITGGNIWAITFGFGGPPIGGAGMLISSGSPTLIDCKLTRNVTGNYGGGLLIYGEGNPTLFNCKITENYADWGAGIYNGASSRAKRDFSNPEFINCTFHNNYACWIGGGIYDEGGNTCLVNCTFSRNFGSGFIGGDSPEFIDCIFTQNTGDAGGGASCGGNPTFRNCIFNKNSTKHIGGGMNCSNALLTDCIFSGNSAGWGGGGLSVSNSILNSCIFAGNRAYGDSLYNDGGGACYLSYDEDGDNTTMMTNCTFYGNWASLGNAISQYRTSFLKLSNCILWDGGYEISRNHPSNLAVSYSDIQGGIEGEGNINADPRFANPGYWADADDSNIIAEPNDPNAIWIDGDYHLKSQAGRWDPASESWVQDDVTSPCIDAGDPNSPIGHESFPNGGIINMGAYGGTSEASKSPSGLHAKYGGGTGEPDNPYLIYTAEHMNTIGLHEEDWDKHFKLMADIDLSVFDGVDFNIIGYWRSWDDYKPFRGTFDGNGYRLLNFTYHSTEEEAIGLFGFIWTRFGSPHTVKNLGLVDPNVDAVNAPGVGALVGELFNGIINGCYVEGGRVSGNSNVGGLLGWTSWTNMGPLERNIVNCYTSCQVSGNSSVGGIAGNLSPQACVLDCQSFGTIIGKGGVGGLIGHSMFTEISRCYTTALVIGENKTGGLVGKCLGGNYAITACVAFGSVDGEYDTGGLVGCNIYGGIVDSYSIASVSGVSRVGGLVGSNQGTVRNCYSAGSVYGITDVGGLIGSLNVDSFYPDGNISNSFWDIETSEQPTSAGGTGKTTAEMQTAGTFLEAGWDFVDETTNGTEDIWWILEDQDYPRFLEETY